MTCWWICLVLKIFTQKLLTPLVLRLEYSWTTIPVPWLLIPCFLVLPVHQQPWYWLCRRNGPLSSMSKVSCYLHHVSVLKWYEMQIYLLVPPQNSIRQDLVKKIIWYPTFTVWCPWPKKQVRLSVTTSLWFWLCKDNHSILFGWFICQLV